MLLIIIAFLMLSAIVISQLFASTAEQIKESESEFMKPFSNLMGAAAQLNAICENNLLMKSILETSLQLFVGGTAQALDLAASTPIWERRLPVPWPEDVYKSFRWGSEIFSKTLSALVRSSRQIHSNLSPEMRSHIRFQTLGESVCMIAEFTAARSIVPTRTRPTSSTVKSKDECRIAIPESLLAPPALRQIRDYGVMLDSLGEKSGFLIINPELNENIMRWESSASDKRREFFSRVYALSLTHPRFCRAQASASQRAHCPLERSETDLGIPKQITTSFEPEWSGLVKEETF